MNELRATELQAFVERHRGGPRRALLLDVREPWETALARIALPGTDALDAPLASLPQQVGALDRLQPVVCICHHGMRSRQAVAFLLSHGFESVYNLAGGTDAWSMEVDPAVARY